MRLVVLGATGATGLEIVRQAIERGHAVTALVRSPERLKPFEDHISIKRGNLLDSADLARALRGQDAVLSAFGPRLPVSKDEAHLLQQFATALTIAMQEARVRRAIVESLAFLFKNSIIPPAYILGKLLFPSIVADASAMEEIFKDSGLDWTMVRPPQLTDNSYTGKYRVREGHLPPFGFRISRADVADFMINTAENHCAVRKVVGLSS